MEALEKEKNVDVESSLTIEDVINNKLELDVTNLSVYAGLSLARRDLACLNISKKSSNDRMKYIGLDDFLAEANIVLGKYLLCPIFSFDSQTATVTLFNAKGESLVCSMPTVPAILPRAIAIQSHGSTSTYLKRYLLSNLLMISEHGARDPDSLNSGELEEAVKEEVKEINQGIIPNAYPQQYSANANAQMVQPQMMQPNVVSQPQMVQSQMVQPQMMQPNVVSQPQMVQSQMVQPQMMQPNYNEVPTGTPDVVQQMPNTVNQPVQSINFTLTEALNHKILTAGNGINGKTVAELCAMKKSDKEALELMKLIITNIKNAEDYQACLTVLYALESGQYHITPPTKA